MTDIDDTLRRAAEGGMTPSQAARRLAEGAAQAKGEHRRASMRLAQTFALVAIAEALETIAASRRPGKRAA